MLQDILRPFLENAYFVKYGLIGLFFNGILNSIIPIPTELTSSALLLAGQNQIEIVVSLTSGTILGGVVSYSIGRNGGRVFKFLHRSQKSNHERNFRLLSKYGWGIILASIWIPVLGDAVTIIAGIKKYDFKKFFIAMSIGKVTHAMAIVYFGSIVLGYINNFKF